MHRLLKNAMHLLQAQKNWTGEACNQHFHVFNETVINHFKEIAYIDNTTADSY